MLSGDDVTVPVPAPERETVNVRKGAVAVNVAVTVCADDIETVQVPVPEQAPPLQPVKVEDAPGVAVRVTVAPVAYAATQRSGQTMLLSGDDVTVPVPAPERETVNVRKGVVAVNVAVTVCADDIETVQVPVPEQAPPLQPVKVEDAPGVAVRVTVVPVV